MFTGIVEELGKVRAIRKSSAGAELIITVSEAMDDLKIGDSIAINGVCLTITSADKKCFQADVMPETLKKTNLGRLAPREKVNLERSLRLSDRVGGHLVSGHIDGLGTISKKLREGRATILSISAPPSVLKYIVRKGSIAVDGVSLTVADISNSTFTVSVIPHTAEGTTLGFKGPGSKVNLEVDLTGKYLEKLVGNAI